MNEELPSREYTQSSVESKQSDVKIQLIKIAEFLKGRLPIDKKSFNEPLLLRQVDVLRALCDGLIHEIAGGGVMRTDLRKKIILNIYAEVLADRPELDEPLNYIQKMDYLNIELK